MLHTKKFKHIEPLYINGLSGRMLRLPAPSGKKREILLLYGHHASLERIYGIAEDLNQYGAVTVPDLPGFGGMDSFYKIGMKPTLDNLADYLAAFIKLRFKRKRITVAGMSFGFLVVTRMLQRYPTMVKQINLLISVVGFAHHDDFTFTRQRYLSYKHFSGFFSHKPTASFFKNVVLHPTVLRTFYSRTHNAKKKFANLTPAQRKANMEFEVFLWRTNDVRTYMYTTGVMLKINNCNKKINLPVFHISVKGDQYFNNAVVEQHMRIIFTDFKNFTAKLPNHAPSVIATKTESAPFIPKGIRKLLAEDPS